MSNLVTALVAKYNGDVMVARANIENLLSNTNGVADHPDVVATLDGLINQLASAEEKLSTALKLEQDKTFIQD